MKKNECEVCGATIENGNAVKMTLSNIVKKEKIICKECFAEWNVQNNDIDILLKEARETCDFKLINTIFKAL